MSDEIELKLVAPANRLRRLNDLSWIRSRANGLATRQTLVSVYYDTKECSLYERGISLRVRKDGIRHVQTIKAMGSGVPFARKEWEMNISRSQPDYSVMGGTALEPLLDDKLKRHLRPVFETQVRRITHMIQSASGIVEVALDQGLVRCRGRSCRISEVEIELKAGSPAALCEVARKVSNSISVAYSAKSKLDRGYALLKGRCGKSLAGDAIVLIKCADIATAFQVIGLSCMRHLTGNEEAVRRRDGEGIHQMRVGLHRMRVAMSIFKRLLADQQSQDLKPELKWLEKQLGQARDYDVCVKEKYRRRWRSQPKRYETAALRAALLSKRRAGFEKAKALVESGRYRRLMLHMALWLADGDWYRNTALERLRSRPAKSFARNILKRLAFKVAGRAMHLEKLDVRRRHKLRIAVKKLRYTAQFFESYFGSRNFRKVAKTLQKLQGELGELNDIVTCRAIIVDLARTIPARGKGGIERRLDGPSGKAPKAGEQLLARAAKAGKRLHRLEL